MKRKILSIVLGAAMLLTMNTGVFAADTEGEAKEAESAPASSHLFTDVDPSAWYYTPVYWAVKKDITSGTSENTFSPDADCTRAQVVTFLWNEAGKPEPKMTETSFTDVSDSDYYYKPVLWAVENGITSGTTATTFGPGGSCTRAQMAAFLWRAQSSPKAGLQASFSDVDTSSYYNAAVNWAVENGVTSGTSATTFSPDVECTRAQAVTFLYHADYRNVSASDAKDEHPSGSIVYEELDGKSGSFTLRAADVAAKSDIVSVRAAVWAKNDRSDLRWYGMSSSGNGSWQTEVNVADHGRQFGIYHAELYLVTENGLQIDLGGNQVYVKSNGYMYAENAGTRQIRVTIYDVPDGTEVRFASWSASDYSDLFWTDGDNRGGGVWSAVIDTTKFKNAGTNHTDAYVKGTRTILNTVSYPVTQDQVVSGVRYEINQYTSSVYSQVGRDLYACFRYAAGQKEYRNVPAPQSGYTHSQWYALYGFKNHKGHCYVHAATFYWLAKNLGYNAYYVEGYVPKKGGGIITHGWVEIVQNGTTYVYDPDFTRSTGKNGYKIHYGQSGTWRYQSYHRVS